MSACTGPAAVVFDPTLTEYDLGPHHPMSPVRIALTMRLAETLRVTGPGALPILAAPMADDSSRSRPCADG